MRKFQNWLSAYLAYTEDSEAPASFCFWVGVSVLAGALRRRVYIDMRKFQWTPNFYIVLVGPPGIAVKSTTIRIGMRLLEQVPGVHFGPPSMTWQALADALCDAVEHVRYVHPESGRETVVPMSCLTIPVSELGTLLKLEDSALVDVLVDLWDGQLTSWGHRTRTRGTVDIRNPWLNVIACTTPAWLRANFPEHMIGGGLTSRIVFVYGDRKRRLIPYPDEMMPRDDYAALEAGLIADLIEISKMQGEYALSQEARAWGRAWYEKHWNERPAHLASERYGGYLARKQTHIHKLAMVLAAARSDALSIEAEHLREAEAILSSVEPHMLRVFDSIGIVDEARHSVEIVALVRAHGFCTSDRLWRLVMNTMSQREFEDALKAAIRAGLLEVERRGRDLGVVAREAPN